MNKKNLIALLFLGLFGVRSYAMEPLKTAMMITPVVTAVIMASNIAYDRVKEGNFKFLTKEYLKNRLYYPHALLNTLVPLLSAMYLGSKPAASITDLLKPAGHAFCSAVFFGLSTAVVCYNLKDAGTGYDRNRMVANNSLAVFNTALFLFAPPFMAYTIYKNR